MKKRKSRKSLAKELERINRDIRDIKRNLEAVVIDLSAMEDYIQSELLYVESKVFDSVLPDSSPKDNIKKFREMFPEAEETDDDEDADSPNCLLTPYYGMTKAERGAIDKKA